MDSCIWLSADKKNFDSAKEQCTQLVSNGRLFEPKNLLENDLAVTFLLKSLQPANAWIGNIHPPNTWIGISDLQVEGKFEYLSSGTEPTFSNWVTGQPDDHKDGEDCVHFWFDSKRWRKSVGLWNDVSCDHQYTYICEQPVTG